MCLPRHPAVAYLALVRWSALQDRRHYFTAIRRGERSRAARDADSWSADSRQPGAKRVERCSGVSLTQERRAIRVTTKLFSESEVLEPNERDEMTVGD